jgi:serine/threonine-protein kinase HipA
MCDENFRLSASPGYDITFAKGEKQTIEHQLSLYGKALSQITVAELT